MVSPTRRTAGFRPACPVVWQGRVGDHSPYADCPDRHMGLPVGVGDSLESFGKVLLTPANQGIKFYVSTPRARYNFRREASNGY
jgi:hypothetical protein